MEIPGHIQNGVVVPDSDLSLPNGTEVTITVREDGAPASMTPDERARYLDALSRIDSVPSENPTDRSRGVDHDRFLYGGGA